MTRGELLRLVEKTGGALRNLGIQQNSRGGDGDAERPGDGGGLRRGRELGDRGAAQRRLSRRRVRFLSRRPRCQGADHPGRPRLAGARGRRAAQDSGDRADGGRERPGRQLHALGAVRGCRRAAARSRRRRPGAAHLWHHVAAQDRAAAPAQPRGFGAQHRGHAGVDAAGPLPGHHAAVPHPRADRRAVVLAPCRRQRALPAGLQRAEVLRLARSGGGDLVHRGADHAPDHPGARRPQRRRDRAAQAAPDPLVLGLAAAAGDEAAGGDLRLPGDRILRHDRGLASDGEQSAAAAPAQARQRRHRRRAGGRDHGSGRQAARSRRDRRDRDPRRQRHRRLRQQSESQRRGLHQRLVPHRRPGRAGCGGLSQPDRPVEGDHQPRRREDRAARGGRRADGSPGGGAGRDLRPAARQAGRRGGGRRRAARRPGGERAGPAQLRRRAPRRLQGAEEDRVPGRDPERRHRQAATHRPRATPGADA